MEPFLYKYFHELTNDRSEGGLVNVPIDSSLWPDSWKKSENKKYNRSMKVPLSKSTDSSLFKILSNRSSDIPKVTTQKLNINDLAFILKSAYGFIGEGSFRRTVPSGGAFFPLELYICIWGNVGNLSSGSYHYDVLNHQLDEIDLTSPKKKNVKLFTNYPWMQDVNGVMLISSVFNRSVKKYGSRGYRYILLEAGHVGQNICLAATERDLSIRPIGGLTEEYFEKILSLDISRERIVYALAF